ncbi:helix-turn-helix domain-containing protein [Nonomuraea sp. NPDC049480]|uniref:helix-turn-helix domain-containing protein n=1 Tax=Nonomuraea sp. NPDC049480 TaxID=3364353 RepID=UPI0037A97C9F
MTEIPEISGSDSLHSGPTALKLLVGAHLRRLREARGLTREDAGYAIRSSHSKISRMECGRTSFKTRDVADLLTLYGVTDDAERASLFALVEQANAPGWWHDYRDVIPDWFDPYLGLEQDAALIRTHEVQFVPGLLQIEDYARAVIAHGHRDESAERIEHRIQVRMRRQKILTPPTRHKLWVVMDEGALRRRVGSEAIMREQLEHLVGLAGQPHITLQVFPFASGTAIGGIGPVTLLRFAQEELHDVVYLEHLTGAQYLTKETDVRQYQHLLNELGVHAPPPAETPAFLRGLIDAL